MLMQIEHKFTHKVRKVKRKELENLRKLQMSPLHLWDPDEERVRRLEGPNLWWMLDQHPNKIFYLIESSTSTVTNKTVDTV